LLRPERRATAGNSDSGVAVLPLGVGTADVDLEGVTLSGDATCFRAAAPAGAAVVRLSKVVALACAPASGASSDPEKAVTPPAPVVPELTVSSPSKGCGCQATRGGGGAGWRGSLCWRCWGGGGGCIESHNAQQADPRCGRTRYRQCTREARLCTKRRDSRGTTGVYAGRRHVTPEARCRGDSVAQVRSIALPG